MQVIPVIDLKGGNVVRAKSGARHLYAPIESRLAATSAPGDVVAGLLDLHPFKQIYIADLDAIEGLGDHASHIAALETQFPDVRFWVDIGVGSAEGCTGWLTRHRGDLVLGSESLIDSSLIAQHRDSSRMLLSLDFRGDIQQGPAQLFGDSALWPRRVIVMTLGRVGSNNGPDIERLGEILTQAQGQHLVYAAGGVRDRNDLRSLQRLGAAGVLVASALHDGHLQPGDLQSLD
jgi:phosphoribosylformimino-5-aminoimidazole carboxamide ribotide isomerase